MRCSWSLIPASSLFADAASHPQWGAALTDPKVLRPLMVDMGLIVLFILQHSLMATESVKRWTGGCFGVLQRSFYVFCTALAIQVGTSLWENKAGDSEGQKSGQKCCSIHKVAQKRMKQINWVLSADKLSFKCRIHSPDTVLFWFGQLWLLQDTQCANQDTEDLDSDSN